MCEDTVRAMSNTLVLVAIATMSGFTAASTAPKHASTIN